MDLIGSWRFFGEGAQWEIFLRSAPADISWGCGGKVDFCGRDQRFAVPSVTQDLLNNKGRKGKVHPVIVKEFRFIGKMRLLFHMLSLSLGNMGVVQCDFGYTFKKRRNGVTRAASVASAVASRLGFEFPWGLLCGAWMFFSYLGGFLKHLGGGGVAIRSIHPSIFHLYSTWLAGHNSQTSLSPGSVFSSSRRIPGHSPWGRKQLLVSVPFFLFVCFDSDV